MEVLTGEELKRISEKALDIRETIIAMVAAAGSGHTAGPLGMADIFAALYFHVLKHDPKNPDWPLRDRLILSNGHINPVRYAAMAHSGYFPVEECLTLRAFGSRLQGHPERERLPGLETTSGPLGSGLSEAAGYAYAARMDGKKFRIFCAMSDGEHAEGNLWEGAMFAAKAKLENLIGIIDRNFIQISGNTEDVMPLEPLDEKYRAFGWNVISIDGHDIAQFVAACDAASKPAGKPTVIIARTIPGKGVKSIEGDYRWHGRAPTKDEATAFTAELEATRSSL
jgi:transketolase